MNNKDAYASYTQFPKYAYDIITYLMNNNELIWKLLKHPEPDAWNKADLTFAEKAAMIYNGAEDATLYRVFLDPGQPDVWTHEACILRVYPYGLIGKSRTVGHCSIMFDVLSHYKINHMTNYQTRVDTITQQLLEVLNGVDVGIGIGKLFFDVLAARDDRMLQAGQLPYKGLSLMMSNFMA